MEQKCKFIRQIEKKNKIKDILIRTILILCVICGLIMIHKQKISQFFINTNGNFDNGILWTGIGSVGGILAFIGVIITIIVTEVSRKRQNEYEYEKQELLEEQFEFKKEIKNKLETLDPIRIFSTEDINIIENNYRKIQDELYRYIIEIKSIDYNVLWFYNRTLVGNYIELNTFLAELKCFIDYITKQTQKYINVLSRFGMINLYNIYERMEILNQLTDKDKEDFNNLKQQIPNKEFMYNNVFKEIGEIKLEIVDYRNNNWSRIVEKTKLVIEERENILKEKLKDIK